MLRKIALLASVVAISVSSAFCWTFNDPRPIIGEHSEIKEGQPYFESYFISDSEVIVLHDLNSPDIKQLSDVLHNAFNNGKKIKYAYNGNRSETQDTWYNLSNQASVQMTQYHIYAGDNAYLRLVP